MKVLEEEGGRGEKKYIMEMRERVCSVVAMVGWDKDEARIRVMSDKREKLGLRKLVRV